MDDIVAEFFRRTILKIPMTEMMTILKAWDFLSESQLQAVNFRQRKESLAQDLVLLCQVTTFKIINLGVPIVVQWLMNPTRNHEVAGSIPGLAQWVKDPVLP